MIRRFPLNTQGRDFVVSDLHGCFAKFYAALESVRFDESVDRVFCGGDMVDRGDDSYRCIKLVDKPWFFALVGNHEEMCRMGLTAASSDQYEVRRWHKSHGGAWLYALPKEKQRRVLSWVETLPYVMEIETDKGLVGMVHADCVVSSWEHLHQNLGSLVDRAGCMTQIVWGDARFSHKVKEPVHGVHHVYVGHIPLKTSVTLGNVTYIDGGACYSDSRQVRIIQIQ